MKKHFLKVLFLSMVICIISGLDASAANITGAGLVTGSVVNIRQSQSTSSAILTQVKRGDILDVYSVGAQWVYVSANGKDGYIFKDYLSVKLGETSRSLLENRSSAESLIAFAERYLGTPYVYGGSSPSGFDCSGFVKYVYENTPGVAKTLNRTAQSQTAHGYWVDRNELKPGDLVFFGYGVNSINHVGIYVGNGKFIHSPRPGKSVCYDSLTSGYYNKNYITARRILD